MRALAAVLVAAVVAVVPGTAAQAADPPPHLVMTFTTDQPSFAENAPFTGTATISNQSLIDAHDVGFGAGGVERLDDVKPGEPFTPFDLAAGATKTITFSGKTNHDTWRWGYGNIYFLLYAGDQYVGERLVKIVVPGAFGSVAGHVYEADPQHAPGQYDETKPLAGVKAVVSNSDPYYPPIVSLGEAVTDATGAFRVDHIPVAEDVVVIFTAPPGWRVVVGEAWANYDGVFQVVAEADRHEYYMNLKEAAIPWPTDTTSASPQPSAQPVAASNTSHPSARPTLPVTGSNTTPLVLAGIAAVVVGAGLVLVARRRRSHPEN